MLRKLTLIFFWGLMFTNTIAQEYSLESTIRAPDFPTNVDWFNTASPLSLADLKGKIVLLDFWTYGCINCIHVIPDLKKLEEKYIDELVVIGVHSAKFDNEGQSENIHNIILRYELEHPVINDKDFAVWRSYNARAWPTLVLINPNGQVITTRAGEGVLGHFDPIINEAIEHFDAKGEINREPINFELEKRNVDTQLLFPGKVLADEAGNRLFIADSNHNRIVISDLEGNILEVIGNGESTLVNGSFSQASFFRPQGLTLANEDTLYVADTENHALRRVNLGNRSVETVAGIGEQVYMRFGSKLAKEAGLNSPWDVLYHQGLVYIAMAGQHQLWVYDPTSEEVRLYAGTGREELKDGPLASAGLNQPSGLATDGEQLYLVDSEASAIRAINLSRSEIKTIVGTGLFDFGDVDGVGNQVRLQHPLGVVYHQGFLYVADTYNSKIKQLAPKGRETVSFAGSEAGWQDDMTFKAKFNEPGGLSIAGNNLYVADTNNHVIRVIDLNSKEVSTLMLLDRESKLTRGNSPYDISYEIKVVRLEPQTVKVGQSNIQLNLNFPKGYKVNDVAPFTMLWQSSDPTVSLGETAEQMILEPSFPLEIPLQLEKGRATLTGELLVYYCEVEAVEICLIDEVRLEIPIDVQDLGSHYIMASYDVPELTGDY